jgi:DNA-binding LacI/PurR family transcriptional regulator
MPYCEEDLDISRKNPCQISTKRPRTSAAIAYLDELVSTLSVGNPLPSVADIQREKSFSLGTISAAYDELEAMGRIKRIQGKGVFVDDPAGTGEIAIVIASRALQPDASLFYPRSISALAAEISAQTTGLQVRMHMGADFEIEDFTEDKFAKSLALDDRETLLRLRGVIAFHPIGSLKNDLVARGIPVCFINGQSNDCRPSVVWDYEHFIRESLNYSASLGVKKLCFFGFEGWTRNPQAAIASVENLMREYGFNPNPNWHLYLKKRMSEAVGYELFNRLWANSQKPEMIISLDDMAATGLFRAANEKGLDIPRDFRFITLANRGVQFPHNKHVTRYQVDSSLQAKTAVDIVLHQLKTDTAGKADVVKLDPVFFEGQTT